MDVQFAEGTLTKKQFQSWLTALRSGDYDQTHGRYFNELTHGMCCLAVLDATLGYNPRPTMADSGESIRSHVHSRTIDRLGGTMTGHCTTANDVMRWSFHQISDWLERGAPKSDLGPT